MIISFEEYSKEAERLENIKISLLDLIDDFVKFDKDFQHNHSLLMFPFPTRLNQFKSYNFYIPAFDDLLHVDYITNGHLVFSNDEYNRLKEFIKDPELYKSIKKFNI